MKRTVSKRLVEIMRAFILNSLLKSLQRFGLAMHDEENLRSIPWSLILKLMSLMIVHTWAFLDSTGNLSRKRCLIRVS